ncbi:hypothetical protein J1N35_034519 [Gossypium stocksii]|uniref:Uncharacterized protein n=1 Tax=Gossypium stocksii TaxID=47602 RepID=A0A9D3ZQ56_9ROSI|nr:hypothetical protein J1N35_034519 [Gossypium stocksii]
MMRNVFQYCLEGNSSNGWRPSDSEEVTHSVEYLRGEDGSQQVNLLVAPTDYRVITGIGIDQGSKDTSSRTNSIFRELNEAIDINSLVIKAHKKGKTTTKDSFLLTWKNSLDFYLEEDLANANMAPSIVNEDVNPTNNDVAPTDDMNQGAGYGFSPISLNMIAGSFAFANCVGGYSSSLKSLNMTAGSFSLANCVEGCSFSPANLNVPAGSFSLTNYVGGCGSLPASLNMIVRSFTLVNCFEGCGFSPTSLNMIVGSFALANCVRGCYSSPVSLNMTKILLKNIFIRRIRSHT